MDLIVLLMFLLLTVFTTSDAQVSMNPVPRLLLDTITYYDMFGDDVGMAYYNGYIQVECEIGPSLYVCTFDQVHLIDPGGVDVGSTPCNDRVTLRLDINENTTFGEYKCQYKNESSSETLPYNYRFCAPEASEDERSACKRHCMQSTTLAGHCLVTANGIHPCQNIEESWCLSNETGVTYCDKERRGNFGDGSSLCNMLHDRSTLDGAHSRVNGDDFCFTDLDYHREAEIVDMSWLRGVSYNGQIMVITKLRPPPDPDADPEERETAVKKGKYEYSAAGIKCPGCYDHWTCKKKKQMYAATCRIIKTNGELIEQRTFDKCDSYYGAKYVFNHSVFTDDQFGLYKFKCTFDNGTAVVARTQNYILDFGSKINASIHKTKKPTGDPEDDKYTKLECRLTSYPPHPWQIEWKWFDNRTSSKDEDEMSQISWANTSIFSVRHSAKYRCEAAIRYPTCSRDILFPYYETIVTSENVTAVPTAGAPLKR